MNSPGTVRYLRFDLKHSNYLFGLLNFLDSTVAKNTFLLKDLNLQVMAYQGFISVRVPRLLLTTSYHGLPGSYTEKGKLVFSQWP